MKPILVFAVIFSASFIGWSQNVKEADVPGAVKEKFASLYPDAKAVEWEMEEGMYEAEFEEGKTEISVLLKADGSYVQREIEIASSSLPPAASNYVAKNLSGKKISQAAIITSADGVITYEAEVADGDYLFDSNGNFIRQEAEDDESEDDDE